MKNCGQCRRNVGKLTDEYVGRVIKEGAEKARKVAAETVREVKKRWGCCND